MKKLSAWFSSNLLTLATIAIIIAILYKFKDFFGSSSRSWINGNTKKLSASGSNFFESQTLSDNELEQIAEMQFAAMDRYGTDETLLFDSLKNLNGKDLVKVFNFFGTRDYEGIQGNSQPIFGTQKNLFLWYSSELNQSELKRMREIWAKAKMNLGF